MEVIKTEIDGVFILEPKKDGTCFHLFYILPYVYVFLIHST